MAMTSLDHLPDKLNAADRSQTSNNLLLTINKLDLTLDQVHRCHRCHRCLSVNTMVLLRRIHRSVPIQEVRHDPMDNHKIIMVLLRTVYRKDNIAATRVVADPVLQIELRMATILECSLELLRWTLHLMVRQERMEEVSVEVAECLARKALEGRLRMARIQMHFPTHPAPVRPGLISNNAAPPPRQPPVRQYNNTAGPGAQTPQSSARPAPAQDMPVTHEELRRLTQMVQTNPGDSRAQLLLAKKMVEASTVLADEGGRADPKTRSRNREKYIFDAHKIVKRLVGAGDTEAMFYLADCYGRGSLGLQADVKEAFNLYQSAAKQGHAQAAYRVAVCCELGQEEGGGTRRDPLKAIQWYKRAATLGDTPAMYKMGMIQLKGLLGQPKEPREAVIWLKRAAEKADEENPHALHELVSTGCAFQSHTDKA